MTFWEHLDELRGVLIKILIVAVIAAIVSFFFKDSIFNIVLAPSNSHFITYRLIDQLAGIQSRFQVNLINVELTQQFMIHLKMSLIVGLFVVSPLLLYLIFGYLSPALYPNERRWSLFASVWGYVMFLIGLAVNYLIIFPLTFRFLASYQVSDEVLNHITLSSYISTFLILSLTMGVVFELPILCWLLAKFGLLKASVMKRYRRHAIVAIISISAIITPSGDAFTLLVVSLPIYLLYELSVLIVGRTERRHAKRQANEEE